MQRDTTAGDSKSLWPFNILVGVVEACLDMFTNLGFIIPVSVFMLLLHLKTFILKLLPLLVTEEQKHRQLGFSADSEVLLPPVRTSASLDSQEQQQATSGRPTTELRGTVSCETIVK